MSDNYMEIIGDLLEVMSSVQFQVGIMALIILPTFWFYFWPRIKGEMNRTRSLESGAVFVKSWTEIMMWIIRFILASAVQGVIGAIVVLMMQYGGLLPF